MQSFLNKAKEVIAKNQDVITVFEELDRTGKFRKRTYKTRAAFTLDEELFNKFRNYCKENGLLKIKIYCFSQFFDLVRFFPGQV